MADFCKQCSIATFGEDYGDLAGLGKPDDVLEEGMGYPVICEGCGYILVNKAGECITPDCLENHGAKTDG